MATWRQFVGPTSAKEAFEARLLAGAKVALGFGAGLAVASLFSGRFDLGHISAMMGAVMFGGFIAALAKGLTCWIANGRKIASERTATEPPSAP